MVRALLISIISLIITWVLVIHLEKAHALLPKNMLEVELAKVHLGEIRVMILKNLLVELIVALAGAILVMDVMNSMKTVESPINDGSIHFAIQVTLTPAHLALNDLIRGA